MQVFRKILFFAEKKLQKRFGALTGIRAIAASMVFLYHNRKYWRNSLPGFMIRNLNEYHTGVTLFFVLSGFLIAYTYKDAPTKNATAYLQYIGIRIARIFPVYWLLLLIQFSMGFTTGQNPWWNFTLLKGLSDKHNLDGIPQSWTLSVELCFYIIAPFIFLLTQKSIWKTWISLFILYVAVIATGYIWLFINGNPNKWLYNWWFVSDATFFGRFNEFFIGVLMAYYLHKQPQWLSATFNKKNITATAALLCMVAIYCISWWEKDIYSNGTEAIAGLLIRNLLLPFLIALLLYGLITEETWLSKLLGSKLMVLLGNASYIFYLIHIGYLNHLIAGKLLLPDRNFILLWLIAIVCYLLFEKPVYIFLKQKIRRYMSF